MLSEVFSRQGPRRSSASIAPIVANTSQQSTFVIAPFLPNTKYGPEIDDDYTSKRSSVSFVVVVFVVVVVVIVVVVAVARVRVRVRVLGRGELGMNGTEASIF